MQELEGADQATREGAPPDQHALPAHGMQELEGERGSIPKSKGEGGTPPEKARMPFVRGLIQGMGCNLQDLTKSHSARSLRKKPMKERPRRGYPPNGRAHLTRAAAKGGRGGVQITPTVHSGDTGGGGRTRQCGTSPQGRA